MQYVLASGPAPWEQALATGGRIAAIILVVELLFFVVIALALNVGLTFAFGWVREKAELVKKLRPVVDSVNAKTEAAIRGTLSAGGASDIIKLPAETADTINTAMHTVAQIPAQAHAVEEKIEQGSDRVAHAVIEFRARTVMVQGIVKAFFLPGLTIRQRRLPAPKSAEVRMLPEDRSPALKAPAGAGDGRLLEPVVSVASGSGSQPASSTGT